MGRNYRNKSSKIPKGNQPKKHEQSIKPDEQDVEANEVTEDPLMNRVIIQNIFAFLSEDDLRSCRLVNTTWTPEADSHLNYCCNYIKSNRFYSTQQVLEFVQIVESSKDFPFTKIELPDKVDQCARDEVLLCLATRLAGLKLGAEPNMLDFPEYLIFPQLKELDFSEDLDAEECNFVPRFLEKYSQQLNSLISSKVRTETLQIIACNPFLQLTKLQLHNYNSEEYELVHDIVNCQKDTLVELKLKVSCQDKNESWFEPVFCPKLKYLSLINIGLIEEYSGDENPFPVLRFLHMYPGKDEMLTPEPLMKLFHDKPANAMNYAILLSDLAPGYYPDMSNVVARLFPNLTRLMFNSASAIHMLRLLGLLNKLTALEIYLGSEENVLEDLTAKLTGLQFHGYNNWKGWSKNDFAEMERQCGIKYKGVAPYSVLQQIRYVTLHCTDLKNKMKNNLELPFRLVFLQMSNLYRLTITHHAEEKHRPLSKHMQRIQERLEQKFEVIWKPNFRPIHQLDPDTLY